MKNHGFLGRIAPAPVNGGFRMDGYWVWCGSVIKGEDGRFHMFASRWPKYLPMHPGWIAASEIVRAVSTTPEGPYEFQEVVLPARGGEYWDGRMTHCPQIVKHKDTYLLYYTGSTHPFPDVQEGEVYGLSHPVCVVGRANKRIGLAVSQSVFGPWQRFDQPILPTRPDKFDSFLTSNPAPLVHEDGSALLVYKTRAYQSLPYSDDSYGRMTLGVAGAEHYTGPYKPLTDEPLFPSDRFHLEDPFIWQGEDGYEMIAKDMDGNICGEVHAGIYASSKDGVHWDVLEKVKAYSRKIKWDDGCEQVMGNLERPFVLFQARQPTHLYFAAADGSGGFRNASNTWNMVIPLLEFA